MTTSEDLRLFHSEKELAASGYIFRIQDNGGATVDRYTVAFCDGDYLSLSACPSHPLGVSQWGERIDVQHLQEEAEQGRAVDLQFGDLPDSIRAHVVSRVNDGWRDFLNRVRLGDPSAVADDRESVDELNEGIHDSGGKGIYRDTNGAYWVAMDGGPDDRGPFATPRAALAATLPDEYSLSGPEYHSSCDASSLNPMPHVVQAIAALEARVSETVER